MTTNQIRRLSDAALAWTIGDLREVIEIQEQSARNGHPMPNLGRYWDDLHACAAERNRRQRVRHAGGLCATCGASKGGVA
jgi:hypothetical protein